MTYKVPHGKGIKNVMVTEDLYERVKTRIKVKRYGFVADITGELLDKAMEEWLEREAEKEASRAK